MARGPGRPRKDEGVEKFSRSSNTRSAQARTANQRQALQDHMKSATYVPPEMVPEGKKYRWISTATTGATDDRNWANRMREGWRPVPRARHPEYFPTLPMPGVGDRSDGAIMYGSLCLCERDEEAVLGSRADVQKSTLEQMEVMKSYVEGGDAMTPRFNESSDAQFVRARENPTDGAKFKDDPVAE